ncbi:uncharacterized protein KRP23_1161 [Phytophthora ramorum]|uniref:uncharacterized protein n=1 Tax=Phytophthora ramorum TaxID=164328 RepID=UPI00309E7571|nr:hypothetical protein KRP23_1161 [Phytophthora ramorum]
MADEVEALKRELEALKLQLEKERKTSAAVQGDTDSPKQLAGPPRDESPKPKRRGGDAKTSAAPKEPRIYVQHAAVGTRRGKWWLRDRQVLSRAMLEEGGGTLKLRESWVWSGRSVVLDKIVRIQEVEGGQEDATLEEEIVMEEEAAVTGEVVENPAARSASPRTAATVPREAQESEAAETSVVPRGDTMEPMRRPGDAPTGYESGTIKNSRLLSGLTIDSIVFGVTLLWSTTSVHEFVQVANSKDVAAPIPVWMSEPRGHLTVQALKRDVMAYLALVAGGLARENDLAPNTMQQKMHIIKQLAYVENDAFVQACMAKLEPNTFLASVLVRCECPGFAIQPACFNPPPLPWRQVFY